MLLRLGGDRYLIHCSYESHKPLQSYNIIEFAVKFILWVHIL